MTRCSRSRSDGRDIVRITADEHPFVDGNKRVASFATDVFLRLNGCKLAVEANAAHDFIVGSLERNECDFERLRPWIRQSPKRL